MRNLRLAIDDNLGLPAGFRDGLAGVVRAGGFYAEVELISFHDIGAMVRAFDNEEVELAFLPGGTLLDLATTPKFIAQATFGAEHTTMLKSALVMRAAEPPATVAELARRKLGRVNCFCTTSYWCPMLMLDDGLAAQRPPKLDFYEAASFDDMLLSVIDGRADAAMVWDAVLARNPDALPKIRQIATYSNLPTPPVIANNLLNGAALDAVTAYTTRFQSEHPSGFFNGFTTPDLAGLNHFRQAMAQARQTFRL